MATMEKVKVKTKRKKPREKEHVQHIEEINESEPLESITDNTFYPTEVEHAQNESLDSNLDAFHSIDAGENVLEDFAEEKSNIQFNNDTKVAEATPVIPEVVAEPIREEKLIIPNPQPVVKVQEQPSAPTFKELSSMINQMKISEFQDEIRHKTEIKPYSFEDIEKIFDMKEIVVARQFAAVFEETNLQMPVLTHPLYEALMEYKKLRSQLIANNKAVQSLISECSKMEDEIWLVKNCQKSNNARCDDGFYKALTIPYIVAEFQNKTFTELSKSLDLLRKKAVEIYAQLDYSKHFIILQINDMLSTSVSAGKAEIIESLKIIFSVIRTTLGFDKELRGQLRGWCCALSQIYIESDGTLESILFVLHHLLRVPGGIRWGLHLIQCDINKVKDSYKALCLFEAILSSTKDIEIEENKISTIVAKNDVKENDYDDELVVASEAKDDSLWLLVDSDGENVDVEMTDTKSNTLRESDILGLLRQIPFERLFKQLVGISEDDRRLLNGSTAMNVFVFVRLLLKNIRTALLLYKKYQELSKELCRLALHSIMYCTDLWEIISPDCEAILYERLTAEYNNVFLAGIQTLENAGSREISTMFISEMPFKLCRDDVINEFYNKITTTLIISDSVWCHYTLITISNVAIARTDQDFVYTVINNLFEIGFLSDFSELVCGEWARTACGMALSSFPHLIGTMLNNLTPSVDAKWLGYLPLNKWKPYSDQLVLNLSTLAALKVDFIPELLKSMNWDCQMQDFNMQQSVAVFLSNFASQYSQSKTQVPEWIWECFLLLKLHHYDWNLHPELCPPPMNEAVELSRKYLITNMMTILTTSWGHSVPLIYSETLPFLVKLANSGRFLEVTHILYYVMPILSASPESMDTCKIFNELLIIILRNEKTYTKMASRFVSGNFPGPNIKSLVEMITHQIRNFSKFHLVSPAPLVDSWIRWLTSAENWQNDWIVIYLLDTIIGASFFDYSSINVASNLLKKIFTMPSSSKSGFTKWLWSNISSNKGSTQCSLTAPYFWYVTIWVDHSVNEETGEMWVRLLDKLHSMNKSKINIDKLWKSVGGSDNQDLTIYKSLENAINTPSNHPILSLMWQQFFYLYLNTGYLSQTINQPMPLGPYFFQDPVNSKLLAKAKGRLSELKNYFKTESTNQSAPNQFSVFYTNQSDLMEALSLWLDDTFIHNPSHPMRYKHAYLDKLNQMINSQFVPWMETVNAIELGVFQNTAWPPVTENTSALQENQYKTTYLPNERILQRLQTYEKPIIQPVEKFTGSQIKFIIEPAKARNINSIQMVNNNLKGLMDCAGTYKNLNANVQNNDFKFKNAIRKLYKSKFFRYIEYAACGAACTGKQRIVVEGTESIHNHEVQSEINENRQIQKINLNSARSYSKMALLSAEISKLAQIRCKDRHVYAENGVELFYLILQYLKNEDLQCSPANRILNTIVTQLGEAFIRNNGQQCIKLINQMKSFHNENLVCSLIHPLELPVHEMLSLYQTVGISIKETHIAFSCLSKFSVSRWLREVKPSYNDRLEFINTICVCMVSNGCNPPTERLMLQELFCVHLDHLVACEFPAHLNQTLSIFSTNTLDKTLPPNCWEHCFAIIEKYPDLIAHHQACSNMERMGHLWGTKREMLSPHGLYKNYAMYIPAMTRYGALFSSIVLNTSMIHQPVLLTHQVCSVVMNMMCVFWNVWLVPKWDPNHQLSTFDYVRNIAYMPWGPDDVAASEIMLNAFVETIAYCINTLPGSTSDFLRLTWQWYVINFTHVGIPQYILTSVHKTLSKLPWTVGDDPWVTFPDLQSISKINNMPLQTCHAFVQSCLGNRKWQKWISELPPTLQSNALYILFPIFCCLPFDEQIKSDYAALPWNLLSLKQFEDIFNWFMVTYHSTANPFYTNKYFQLLYTVAGLKPNLQLNQEWQGKRLCLIREWVSKLSFLADSKLQLENKNLSKNMATSVTQMLKLIELTVQTANSPDFNKLTECTALLNMAIMMLNFPLLKDIVEEKWIDWVSSTSKLCLEALIGCILNVTQKVVFLNISECCLRTYFKFKGEWNFVVNHWKNNCVIQPSFLIENNALLTALSTHLAQSTDKSQDEENLSYEKNILKSFHIYKPTSSNEKEIAAWIIYIVSNVCNSSHNKDYLKNVLPQLEGILEKWSEKPNIIQALISQNMPTDKFRIIVKFAHCFLTRQSQKIKGAESPDDVKRIINVLDGLSEQKSTVDVKFIIGEYRNHLQQSERSVNNFTKDLIEMSSLLYPEANFLTNLSDTLAK